MGEIRQKFAGDCYDLNKAGSTSHDASYFKNDTKGLIEPHI